MFKVGDVVVVKDNKFNYYKEINNSYHFNNHIWPKDMCYVIRDIDCTKYSFEGPLYYVEGKVNGSYGWRFERAESPDIKDFL